MKLSCALKHIEYIRFDFDSFLSFFLSVFFLLGSTPFLLSSAIAFFSVYAIPNERLVCVRHIDLHTETLSIY